MGKIVLGCILMWIGIVIGLGVQLLQEGMSAVLLTLSRGNLVMVKDVDDERRKK